MEIYGGGVIIGLSSGVKIYNLCFGLFVGLYEILSDVCYKNSIIQIKIKNVVIKGIAMLTGCIAGFLLANPILLVDRSAYFSNLALTKRSFEISYIWELLTKKRIEWDLVNSGGFSHCVISLIGLSLLLIISYLNKSSRRLSVAAGVTFVVMIVLFSTNSRVLGWYYIPMLFMLPLCVTENNFLWILIVINLFSVKDDLLYQIQAKLGQIRNVNIESQLENWIKDEYRDYEDYERVYLVDVGLQNIGTTFWLWNESVAPLLVGNMEKDCYIVVSDRYRKLEIVDEMVSRAKCLEGGYQLLSEYNGIYTIVYKN